MRRDPEVELATNRFVIVVGRDYGGGGPLMVEARLRKKLRDAVFTHLTSKMRIDSATATRTADFVVADKLGQPGKTVVYLTATQLALYVNKVQKTAL